MDDPMKEFEDMVKSLYAESDKHRLSDGHIGRMYEIFALKLSRTINQWRKRHTEQNNGLSVEVFEGELLPEMLKKQCGFGEEE